MRRLQVFGLAVMAILFSIIPAPEGEGLKDFGFVGSIRAALGEAWKPIVFIWAIMVLRAFAMQSFATFVPVLYSQKGHTLVSIGGILSLFTISGAISGLLAGHLSDRFGYKRILCLAHGLATPSLYLLLWLPGNWIYVSAFFAGFFVRATMPLGVAMAQELAPKGRSMVSSLIMGLAYGLGGFMTTLTGKLADIYSIRGTLAFIAIIPLLTIGLIALLPGRNLRASSE